MIVFIQYLLLSAYELSFILPIILILAVIRKSLKPLKVLPLVLLILILNQCANRYTTISCEWNWQGKIQEILWPLIAVYIFHWFKPKEVGYTLPQRNRDWLWGAGIGLLLASVGWIMDMFLEADLKRVSAESLLYQFTMPGFAEEPVYRGLLLATFNQYFKPHWEFLNVKMGWGVLFTALLFSAGHILVYSSKEQAILWNFSSAEFPFIVGLIFGWLREKSRSIWPCVLAHNCSNGFYHVSKWVLHLF